jgi:ATP synthase protein I
MGRLEDLDQRLEQARAGYEAEHTPKESHIRSNKEMVLGIRAFMEMIGVLLGSGLMGWALDSFLGTAPKFLIGMFVLGILAAFFNLYKLSKNLGTAIGSNNLQSPEKTARTTPENAYNGEDDD